jgi:tetratricopeptide (TPR) repeat protein
MENDDLAKAIAVAKAGDLQQARTILAGIVQANPQSEQGWLWLGHCMKDPQKRLYCYQKVLTINPRNEVARRAILTLGTNAQPAQPSTQAKQHPPQANTAKPASASTKNEDDWKIPTWLPFAAIGLFLVVLILPFLYLSMTGRIPFLVINPSPSPMPSATPLPTATATLSPSPTPTRPTETPTPSPTPTVHAFTPGDPTATPLGSDITDPNYLAGLDAYNANNYKETIRLLSLVIKASPDLAPPYRYRGLASLALKDCKSGYADENKAVTLNPYYAVAWADRGLLNDCLGNNDQEYQDYQTALSIDPSLAFIYVNMGADAYNSGDFETAVQEDTLAITIDPSRADAWDHLAEAERNLGHYAVCLTNVNKAISLKPDLWKAYIDRGNCYQDMNNDQAAKVDYQKFIDNNPNDADSWFDLGLAEDNLNDQQSAITSYTKALELDPTYYAARINRGLIYNELKKYTTALNDFNTVLKNGDIALAYIGRGSSYLGLKEFNLAITNLNKGISLDPYDPCAYRDLAYADYAIGKYQDSLEAAESSRQLDPNCGDGQLLATEARSYFALGNNNQALTYIDKAIDDNPYFLFFYYRGTFYQAAKRNDEAIQDFQDFIANAQNYDYTGPEVADAKARLRKLQP